MKTCLCFGFVALLVTLVACGGGSGTRPGPPVTVITLSRLTPNAVVAGDPGFTLVLTGSGFLPGAKVNLNGALRDATVVNSSELHVSVSDADTLTAGALQVSAVNSDGSTSSSLPLSVSYGAPVLNDVSPEFLVAGTSTSQSLQLNGSRLVPISVVMWNSQPRPTTFVSSTAVVVSISSADVASVGSAQIVVSTAGGGSSSAQTISVVNSSRGTFLEATILSAPGSPSTELVDANFSAGQLTTFGAPPSRTGRFIPFSGVPIAVALQRQQTCNVPSPPPECATPLPNEIYVRDTCLGSDAACAPSTTLVSVTVDAQSSNGSNNVTTISDDGRYIAFESAATNLTLPAPKFTPQIYIRDTCQGAPTSCVPGTTLLSTAFDGSQANGASFRPHISAGGRFIIFRSLATNLVNPPIAIVNELFLRDTCLGVAVGCTPQTVAISVLPDGTPAPAGPVATAVSEDGRLTAFTIFDGSPIQHALLRDTCIGAAGPCTPATTEISVDTGGKPLKRGGFALDVSASGRYVSWETDDSAVESCPVGADAGKCAVGELGYLLDTCHGAPAGCVRKSVRVTLTDAGQLPNQSASLFYVNLSRDGRFVTFASTADNVVQNDTNGNNPFGGEDFFVRDTCLGAESVCQPSTVRVSVASDGSEANDLIVNPTINPSGAFVTFWSKATNLITGTTLSPGGIFRLFVAGTR